MHFVNLAIRQLKRLRVNGRRARTLPPLAAVPIILLALLTANTAQAGYAAIVIDADT